MTLNFEKLSFNGNNLLVIVTNFRYLPTKKYESFTSIATLFANTLWAKKKSNITFENSTSLFQTLPNIQQQTQSNNQNKDPTLSTNYWPGTIKNQKRVKLRQVLLLMTRMTMLLLVSPSVYLSDSSRLIFKSGLCSAKSEEYSEYRGSTLAAPAPAC